MSFHTLRPSHCLSNKTTTLKPTPNIKSLSCDIVKVRVCAYMYTQKVYHQYAQEGYSISYRASTVALLLLDLKVAKFQCVRTERNKRLLICLESRDWGLWVSIWLSERGHLPPSKPRRWTFDGKGTTFF